MQTLRFILLSFITLTIISNAQTVIPPGDVSGTWDEGGSPYEIQGEITIPNGLTLTIEPDVLVEFQGHYQFNVQGRLLAIGTETDTITFTINDTTGFHNPNIPDGGWHSIRFSWTSSANDSSKIVYCKLQYGKAIGSVPDNHGGAIWVDHFDKLIISNCLITNNIAWGGDYPSGGGISLYYSSPKITGNTISYNSAMHGGGIDCGGESSPLIANNFIVNNSATDGGGIIFNGSPSPILTNTIIENNNATSSGGGILSNFSSSPILDNVTISNNSAGEGGGIAFWYSSPSLQNVTISNNSANHGGGISSSKCNLYIDNCSFINNEALTGAGGAIDFTCGDTLSFTYQLNVTNSIFNNNIASSSHGGIRAKQGDSARVNVVVDKCEFTNNHANESCGLSFQGDYLNFTLDNSIFSGNESINRGVGAMFINGCTGTVSNCLFVDNNVVTGGGYYNFGSVGVWLGANVDFMNCTFADNSAFYGAGLTVGGGGTATTTNCIFWGNSKDQIALDTTNGQGGTLTINYCDVQGGEDSVNITDPLSTLSWGNKNIDAGPFFVDPLILDYHLQNSSPCIGAAIDAIEINGIMCYCPMYDIEGNPRPDPAGSMPDIGAYESPLANPVGVEENETVHPTKYALFQNYPNPFNPTTIIKYQIPELSFVTIKVYDVLGNEIATLVDEEKVAENYEIEFNASQLPSGVYFYQLKTDEFLETKKMILMK